eukprot:EG_transcript_4990
MTGPTAAKAPKALPEETGQQFEWLHQAVRRFAEELDEALSSLSGNVSTAELQERLQGQKLLLDVLPPLNLVTVGATKAGKSTLVNAMLSRRGWRSKDDFYEILPRRLLAETNAFWRVMTSRIGKFEFEYEKDHQFFDSFQGLASFIQTHYSRGSVKNNSLVTLRVPALFTSVCGGDFVLIDSPGLSEARFPHFVHEFLQDNPHILIYVIPITAGCLTTIDDNFLSEIFKSSRIQRSSTCVFVLSCYDRALGETDREEVDRSVTELQHRIEDMFAAKAFPTSCLVLQRGCFNPAFSEVEALRQMDDLLRFIEREFLRNSRVVVLKSIFAATQDLGYDAYNACLSYYKVQYKGIQTQRMFSLFEKLESLKGNMLDLFKSCLEDILQPPPQVASKAAFSASKGGPRPLDQPAANLREHVEVQVAKLYAAVGKRTALEGFTAMFKKDFWDKNSFQAHLLEQLRPSIKSYIVCAVEDALKGVCVSFLQLCRSEILENAQANLDAETFQELAHSLGNLAAKGSSGTAAGNLAQLLSTQNVALMGIATQAVDKLASQATSRALFMVTKFNPIWNRSTAAQRVAVAVADQLGAASSHFFTETRDIALRLLEDITRAVKVGTQDYYRTINAETVLQRHPQLKVVHLLLEGTAEVSRRMSRLEAILSADADVEFEEQEEAERRRVADEAEQQRRLQREAAKRAADAQAHERPATEAERPPPPPPPARAT